MFISANNNIDIPHIYVPLIVVCLDILQGFLNISLYISFISFMFDASNITWLKGLRRCSYTQHTENKIEGELIGGTVSLNKAQSNMTVEPENIIYYLEGLFFFYHPSFLKQTDDIV